MTNEKKLAEIERLLNQSRKNLNEVGEIISEMEDMTMIIDPIRPKQTESPILVH